jgi:hypothetical protein
MNSGQQERSALLSDGHDEEFYFDETSDSPEPSDEDKAALDHVAFPYKTVSILVFSNAMAIASFQVTVPFISEFFGRAHCVTQTKHRRSDDR